MNVYPLLDIRIPETKELQFFNAMRNLVRPPWQCQEQDAFGRSPFIGSVHFHRGKTSDEPPCTLCIRRKAPGHFIVGAIVPDANTVLEIPHDQYIRILTEFESEIAEPASRTFGGMTSIGTGTHTLEDLFSPEAVRLLRSFCETSNAADLGTHPSDQEKWMTFLLHVHQHDEIVPCDTFGACLKEKHWWPDEDVARLVSQYDFSMRLLTQASA